MSACWDVRRSNKKTVASFRTFIQKKAARPSLILQPGNSVPLHMSLVSFKLLSQCWSLEPISPSASKSMCRPCKRSTWDSSQPLFHSATTSIVFHSHKLWGLLFWDESRGLRAWFGAGNPLLLRGAATAKIALLISNHHTWVWDQPVSGLCPPTSLDVSPFAYL